MFPRVDVIGGLVVYLAGLGAWVLADWILGSLIPGIGLWDFFFLRGWNFQCWGACLFLCGPVVGFRLLTAAGC